MPEFQPASDPPAVPAVPAVPVVPMAPVAPAPEAALAATVPATPSVPVAALSAMMLRELRAMRREIEAYPDDASIWAGAPGIENPGGTLALHCAGNLQHYVGAVLGGTGYVRDRPGEFALRALPRLVVLSELDRAAEVVERTLAALPAAVLARPFPETVAGQTVRTDSFLAHLAVHLAYHLGQLDYHRRLVTGDGRTVGTMAVNG